ncbi:MAG TPA: hypothetical protein VFD67_02730 [Gemmatimonadaceae bacterium]|jgi:hypothetical protein|nr:hypothetical protein [Gemmatimonadaceae bacterium]
MISDAIAVMRASMNTRREAIVASAMDLTTPESEAFWPLYRDYRTDMAKLDDGIIELIIVYAGSYNFLTDEMSAKFLADYLEIERALVETKTTYLRRFLEVLPATKVARFYQVDNRLDKKIQAELAVAIPLAR